MGKKKDNGPVVDQELQNAVIELLSSGDDTGCIGSVVVGVEEFLKVQSLITDRTGETYSTVADDNDTNYPDDDEEDERDDEESEFDENEDDDDDEDEEWDDDEVPY